MFETLREWMAGPMAGKTMLFLRGSFFICFAVASALLLLPGRDTLRRGAAGSGRRLLALVSALGFLAIAGFQMRWQIFGATNPDLMRFVRRHNARPGVDVRRGSILDRNGSVLAIDGEGGVRRQPLGAAAAHVVGYIDPMAGFAGLEKAADAALSGVATSPMAELGRMGKGIVSTKPVEGGDVRVTLDARLQRFAYGALEGRRGAVVALNPDTGEIYALASAPSFDPLHPNERPAGADAPFLNRALQGRYPPGSTFKVAMALMAADMHIAPVLDCPASGYRAEGESRPIRDSEYYIYKREGRQWRGFGKIGLHDALVHSSNVYFAQLARRIPVDSFNGYVSLFGINEGQTLFGDGKAALRASPGSVPVLGAREAKAMMQLAIGQGRMMVSPLNVAMWTAVAANGGVSVAPTLDPSLPQIGSRHRVVSRTTAGNVAVMMRDAVKSGTGRGADIPGLEVCGKTGTAQNPRGADHAWFTCFSSATEPRLVVTVLVENAGYGSRSAVPIARKILEEAVRIGLARTKEVAK